MADRLTQLQDCINQVLGKIADKSKHQPNWCFFFFFSKLSIFVTVSVFYNNMLRQANFLDLIEVVLKPLTSNKHKMIMYSFLPP